MDKFDKAGLVYEAGFSGNYDEYEMKSARESMKVSHDGEIIEDEFIYGMVTNSLSVGGFKGISGPDVLLDDGLFEVTLIKNPKNPIELNKILAGLANRENDNELIYSFKTSELHVESEEEIPWTLDGEFGGSHTDLTITNLNKQITIMC